MKNVLETQPKKNIDNIKPVKGNGGFTYLTLPWIIPFDDEGQVAEFEGVEFYPITGDMMLSTTTYILHSELGAWREWARD